MDSTCRLARWTLRRSTVHDPDVKKHDGEGIGNNIISAAVKQAVVFDVRFLAFRVFSPPRRILREIFSVLFITCRVPLWPAQRHVGDAYFCRFPLKY